MLGSFWTRWHELRILSQGIPLAPDLLEWAARHCIHNPESIRLLSIEEIPLPCPVSLRRVLASRGLGLVNVSGLCLNRGIYLTAQTIRNSEVIRHELIHTRQYQEAGSHLRFLFRYLCQTLSAGYYDAEMEVEARRDSHPD